MRGALGQITFRRYGMPFAPAPKERLSATARACRAVVAARIAHPGSEWAVFGALQLANFTTPLLLDDDRQLQQVLREVPGVDAARVIAMLDSPEVSDAYERDRAESRTAAGSPAELQDKTATTDGAVRFTAPSLVFERGEAHLVAGGFQPVEAYDVLIANLDPTLSRRLPPPTPGPLLAHFDEGLTTQEVAALLAAGNDPPDRVAGRARADRTGGRGWRGTGRARRRRAVVGADERRRGGRLGLAARVGAPGQSPGTQPRRSGRRSSP